MSATRLRLYVLGGVLAAAAVVAGSLWSLRKEDRRTPSVAVLPFTTDAGAPGTRYFADGFHDTIISQLSRIQGLKVIARASVLEYRETPRDLKKVAEQLGVAHLVEGDVRRTGQRLQVTARLVAAASGRQLWAGEYSRDMADIFSVQSDMARKIAAAIDARITVEEDARLAQAPTRSLDAYELYLRALDVEAQTPPNKASIVQALGWLDQALRGDPGFALAHGLASRLHMTIYWVVGEYDATRLPVAHEHARRAVELGPQLAEAHLAMALYWYWGHRDYSKALASLDTAKDLEPNSSSVRFLSGSIYRRLGRWNLSATQAAWAAQLDPRNARSLQVYVDVLSAMRDFEEAEKAHAALALIAPRSPLAFLMRVENMARWTGGPGNLDAEQKRFEPKEDPYCLSQFVRFELLMLKRQFHEAATTILSCPGDSIGALHNVPAPKEQFATIAYGLAGEAGPAAEHAKVAHKRLAERLAGRPDLVLTRMGLAYVLAFEGKKAEALAEADKAVADMPMSQDAIVGAEVRDQAAALHAYLGEHDRALKELADTLEMVYGSYAQLVRLNPLWDSLREDPRFEKLIAEHRPSVPWYRRIVGPG
jgi:TolB-like protein